MDRLALAMVGLVPHHFARSQHSPVEGDGAARRENRDDVRDDGARHRKQRLAKPVPESREMTADYHSPAETQQSYAEEQQHARAVERRVGKEWYSKGRPQET